MDNANFYLSFSSFFIAAFALGWNVFRDCIDKGKPQVNAYIALTYSPNSGPQPEVLSVKVTNRGRRTIVVDGHGFLMKDKTVSMPLVSYDAFHGKRLEPGEHLRP